MPLARTVDSTVPSNARVYDYLLGGKDNFAADRAAADLLMRVVPEAPLAIKANRAFGARVTAYLARQGIRQFIDLGCGIPSIAPAIHDAAREMDPHARVVYVDNDPIAVTHSNALRSISDGLGSVLGDVRRPQTLIGNDEVTRHIDFSQPVAVLAFSVFDLIADADDPVGIVRSFREWMAPGSYLGLSHLSGRSEIDARQQCQFISEQTGLLRMEHRHDQDVLEFFGGFDLVDPGLTDVRLWHPAAPTPEVETSLKYVGAVGRLSF